MRRREALFALLALGCSRRPPARRPARITRVVSLAPSVTEVLYALGASARVVGVTTFDDFPPEVRGKPKVGGIVNPSFEAITALRPDAVFGVQGPIDRSVLDRLAANGVVTEFPKVESIPELLASVDRFAALLDRRAEGASLRLRIESELREVSRASSSRPRVRALAVFSAQPLVVAGRGSWIDEVLGVAGGVNAMHTGARYPSVSVEVILRAAPSIVLDLSTEMGGGDVRAAITAHGARAPRIVALRDAVFLRPGPRVGEAARRLAAVLQGASDETAARDQ